MNSNAFMSELLCMLRVRKLNADSTDAKTPPKPGMRQAGRELEHQRGESLVFARQCDVSAGTIVLGDDPHPAIG